MLPGRERIPSQLPQGQFQKEGAAGENSIPSFCELSNMNIFRELGVFDMLPDTYSEGGMRWTGHRHAVYVPRTRFIRLAVAGEILSPTVAIRNIILKL
jgi:hypothetical protein